MAFHRSWLCRFAAIKVVSVHDWRLAISFWGSILVSFLFTVYCIIAFKGYQETDDAVTTMSIKVKGLAHSLIHNHYHKNQPKNTTNSFIYDETDLVHTIDSETIFITTAFYEGYNQIGHPHGDISGNNLTKINPTELEEFTIYWRQDLYFPYFNYRTSTAIQKSTTANAEPEFHKSFLSLKSIMQQIQNQNYGEDIETSGNWTLSDLAAKGAIIKVNDDWNCDLDRSENACHHELRVRRLDFGDGYNYWIKINDDGEHKKIEKRYGIKLVFATNAVAGKFSFWRLFVAIGAAFAYVGLIRLTTDLILMYCPAEHLKYYNEKYDHLWFDEDQKKWVLGKNQMFHDDKPPHNLMLADLKTFMQGKK